MALPTFSPRWGIKSHGHGLHTGRKGLFITWGFCSPAETKLTPFSMIFHFSIQTQAWHHFHRRAAQFIGIMVINGDPNTLAWSLQPSAFLFVCCWSSGIFRRLVSAHGFIPRAAPYTDVCHINCQTETNDTLCLITAVWFLNAVVMVIAFRGLWRH